MNALIDIKTAAGRSLENFPVSVDGNEGFNLTLISNTFYVFKGYTDRIAQVNLYEGDTVTIKIE